MHLTTILQSCPICGRRLLIPVEYLGRQVVCNHCRGRFQARDTSCDSYSKGNQEPTLMDRADKLLQYSMSEQPVDRFAAFPFPLGSE